MSLLMCPHYLPRHDPSRDFAFIQRMEFPWLKMFQANGDQIRRVLEMPHKPRVVIRLYDISSVSEAMRLDREDPVDVGRGHAIFWTDKLDRWNLSEEQLSRCVFEGLNEPPQQFNEGTVWQVSDYYVSYIEEMDNFNLAACAGQINTGWPMNHGPGQAPDWEPYRGMILALRRYGGYVGVHEYWMAGPDSNEWLWNPGRIFQRPDWMRGVPILVTECGYDRRVSSMTGHPRGWNGNMPVEQYAGQLYEYADRMAADPDIVALFPFTHDYEDHQWESFDTVPVAERGLWPSVHHQVPDVPPDVPPDAGSNFDRAFDFVIGVEGGLSTDIDDPGNWTGCEKHRGEFKGTKFGVSACTYKTLDIENLTIEGAKNIYRTDYWIPSGASAEDWPLCLLVFDAAVQHGTGLAKQWLEHSDNPWSYMAERQQYYTGIREQLWSLYGKPWMRRMVKLMRVLALDDSHDPPW